MHAKGHLGMALLITFSLLSIFKLKSPNHIVLALLTAGLATLPDIDIKLELTHRKYTHNILSSIILGLFTAHLYKPLDQYTGFVAGFSATWIHILGDLPTHTPFPPLWPILKKKVSLKLFKSNNPIINNTFWILGITTTLAYFLFIYSNTGHTLIDIIKQMINLLTRK